MDIDNSEYESLARDARILEELYSAGVDNWDGYEYIDWDYVNGE